MSERRIYIRFSGPGIAEFRAIVADNLDEISEAYHKLQYEKMIPCNCKTCKDVKEPHFFKYSVLKKRIERGKKSTIECESSEEDVEMRPLLAGFGHKRIEEEFGKRSRKPEPEQTKKPKIIKIFLASSSELKDDRKEFEIFINRKNKQYVKAGVFLELVLWEDFLDAMSQDGLQEEYNKIIEGGDVFVSLYHTKVGPFTEEEFERASKAFKKKGKPLVYTYFKDAAPKMSEIKREDFLSLDDFKKKLKKLKHYPTIYADTNDLKYKFSEQLIKILPGLTGISQSTIEQHDEG